MKGIRNKLANALVLIIAFAIISISQFDLSKFHPSIINDFNFIQNDQQHPLPVPVIYNNTQTIPNFLSSGPRYVHPNINGLYEFSNVCLTKHLTGPTLRGLIYMTSPDDEAVLNNPHRCVPCSAPLNHKGGWDGIGRNQDDVHHTCGFVGIHAMYATNVTDWSECMSEPHNLKQMKVWGQHHLPSRAETVHFYKEPVLALAFDTNIGHALWDHLLTYLPHWYEFRNAQNNNKFPFRGIISHSIENCLAEDNSAWYCEILRAMDAFGGARELPLGPPSDRDATLYCYEHLMTLHLALPRNSYYEPSSMPNKTVFDSFRDVLFDKFSLPRHRNIVPLSKNKDVPVEESLITTAAKELEGPIKILFYAHAPSGRRVWTNMNELIANVKNHSKFRDTVEFQTVYDFGALSVKEQAHLFNNADALIMVHGAQMANSIFSVGGTTFVELGCQVPSFLGAKSFLALIDGHYRNVLRCYDDGKGSLINKVCIECNGKGRDIVYYNFTMTESAFGMLLNGVVRDTQVARDSKRAFISSLKHKN